MVWGAYESTEPTPAIMMPIPGNCPPFTMAFSTWSRSTLGGRIPGIQSRRYHLGEWGKGARGGEEASKWRHARKARLTCWGTSTLSSRSLNFSSEVQAGGVLGGGFGKQPQMRVGVVRWRKGVTRALNTAEGKKEKKHILPCFSFFCFHLHYRKTTMEMSWESMHRPSPREV